MFRLVFGWALSLLLWFLAKVISFQLRVERSIYRRTPRRLAASMRRAAGHATRWGTPVIRWADTKFTYGKVIPTIQRVRHEAEMMQSQSSHSASPRRNVPFLNEATLAAASQSSSFRINSATSLVSYQQYGRSSKRSPQFDTSTINSSMERSYSSVHTVLTPDSVMSE